MTLYDKINDDIKTAMKSKEQKRLDVLRMMKTKIMTVDARGNLPEQDMIKILSSYEKSLKDALTQYETAGRDETVIELKQEIAIIQEYLPKKLDEASTKALVIESIKTAQAESKKDLGKVMKLIMSSGQIVEGALVKKILDELLV